MKTPTVALRICLALAGLLALVSTGAQAADTPHIVYAQDFWVASADYQDYNTAELLQLWELLNRHLCRILADGGGQEVFAFERPEQANAIPVALGDELLAQFLVRKQLQRGAPVEIVAPPVTAQRRQVVGADGNQ